jgi:hypothetical protein
MFVGWELNGEWPRGTITDIALLHGMERELGFPRRRRSTVCLCAVEALADSLPGSRSVRVSEDALQIVYKVCEIDGRPIAKVAYNRETGDSDITGASRSVKHRFREELQMADGVYTANNLCVAFRRALLNWGAVRMIARGGWWYVPQTAAGLIARWARFVADIGGHPITVPLTTLPDTLGPLVQRQLSERLSELVERIRSIVDGRRRVRGVTLERIEGELGDLQRVVAIYQQSLAADFTAIINKASELRVALEACGTYSA